MISNTFKVHLEKALKNAQLTNSPIESVNTVSGGSVNRAYQLQCGKEHFFLKVNRLDTFPKMFEKEELGLNLLRKSSAIAVPKALLKGESLKTKHI